MKRLIALLKRLARHTRAAGACAAWVPLVMHPLKDAPTHEMLRAALKEPDPVVRERALEALALIRDPADAANVRALLNTDLEATRQQAAKTAGVLGLPLTTAQRAAETHARPAAPARIAADALRSTNTLALVHGLRNLDADTASQQAALLLPLLRHPEVVVLEETARAVQRGRIVAAAPVLIALLEDVDEGVRHAAANALSAMFDSIPKPGLTTAMTRRMELDPSSFVRRVAGLTLVALHDDAAREALLALLQHERGMTRASAAFAVGAWGEPTLATRLHPLLVDQDERVARTAASALGRLKSPDSKAPLLAAFLARGPFVQERVAWALGELKSTEAVPAMTARLVTTDEPLKTSLVLALGKTGDKRSLPPIRQVLMQISYENSLPRAREAAFVALAAVGDKLAIQRAIQIVTTPVVPPPPGAGPSFDESFVRNEGLRYLATVGDKATGAALLAAIKDGLLREMRPTVAETLSKLLGKNYQPIPDEDFRRYFVESLDVSRHKVVPAPGAAIVP